MAHYRLDCIYFPFVMPGVAVRNLQDHARIAAAADFRTRRMERDFVENIRLKRIPRTKERLLPTRTRHCTDGAERKGFPPGRIPGGFWVSEVQLPGGALEGLAGEVV